MLKQEPRASRTSLDLYWWMFQDQGKTGPEWDGRLEAGPMISVRRHLWLQPEVPPEGGQPYRVTPILWATARGKPLPIRQRRPFDPTPSPSLLAEKIPRPSGHTLGLRDDGDEVAFFFPSAFTCWRDLYRNKSDGSGGVVSRRRPQAPVVPLPQQPRSICLLPTRVGLLSSVHPRSECTGSTYV